ncbi:MAG: hypothetical protein MHM6MM_006493 [Cercozoa sp. M6MM]
MTSPRIPTAREFLAIVGFATGFSFVLSPPQVDQVPLSGRKVYWRDRNVPSPTHVPSSDFERRCMQLKEKLRSFEAEGVYGTSVRETQKALRVAETSGTAVHSDFGAGIITVRADSDQLSDSALAFVLAHEQAHAWSAKCLRTIVLHWLHRDLMSVIDILPRRVALWLAEVSHELEVECDMLALVDLEQSGFDASEAHHAIALVSSHAQLDPLPSLRVMLNTAPPFHYRLRHWARVINELRQGQDPQLVVQRAVRDTVADLHADIREGRFARRRHEHSRVPPQ